MPCLYDTKYVCVKTAVQALGKLESVQDLGALDWRGTAEAAVRAALAGGAKECDVLVLRRRVDGAGAPAPEATEPPPPAGTEEGGGRAGGACVEKGWRDRGEGAWSKRFLGSVGHDGVVSLEEEDWNSAVPTRGG